MASARERKVLPMKLTGFDGGSATPLILEIIGKLGKFEDRVPAGKIGDEWAGVNVAGKLSRERTRGVLL